MAKSILHKKDGTCYLCRKLYCDYSIKTAVEEHHVMFGNPGRKLSERYGLKVYLCIPHHRTSSEAVHTDSNMAKLVKKDAQREFEKFHSRKEWMDIFRENILWEEE